ncbi:hypothetical protein FRC07_014851 [Ceratobasidium sp. 392]|nr:hypothetical protein FRC07_014851 [Ceratobasidium sp. 392]
MPDESVVGIAPQIVGDLAPFLLGTVEETLSLVLETLTVLLKVEKGRWLTPELAASLTSALLDVWQKNVKDLVLLSVITDVFECLAVASYQTTVTQALPLLSTALASVSSDETWITSSALEIITSLMRGAQEGQLGQGFFATLGPALFKAIGEAEDREVIQNGIECLTLIIRKEHTQLAQWHDSNGHSGFENVLNFLARLLQRDQNESGGLVVGDLIIHLFRRAGEQIGPVLPGLLQAMVVRIESAKTATFLQSLIVPFAFLIYSQRDTVLNMLEASAVGSRSGLEVLVYAWCENAEMLQGNWPSRISVLALCQLFLSDRQSLRQIHVKGDLIVKPETQNVIITRSRAKQTPHEFKSVPFPTKALQLIVRELQSMGAEVEPMGAKDVPDATEDDSDDADEWADEEKLYLGMKRDELAFLAGVDMEDGEADGKGLDDEDLRQDPISKIDMRAHLLQFLKECAAHDINNFSQTVEQLGAEEMLVVNKACANTFRALPSLCRLFHATPSFSETYKSRQARAAKRKNLLKRQDIDQSSQADRPDPILGHSKTPEGRKLWVESDLCKILLTPEKILSAHPREISTESGQLPLPQYLNFGIKSKEEELVFRTLPDVASQQAFFATMQSQYDPTSKAHVQFSQGLEAKANISAVHLSRLTDLRNASAAGIAAENRRRCVEAFSPPEKPNDSGRSEVQGIFASVRSI